MGEVWTEARVAELTELWDTTLSTKEIGKVMGLTKGQVIGKSHRLGLPARPRPPSFVKAAKPKPKPEPKVELPKPKPAVKTRTKRERDGGPRRMPLAKRLFGDPDAGFTPRRRVCQYIAGTPTIDDGCKCGKPVKPGSSYCPVHHAVCWTGSRYVA